MGKHRERRQPRAIIHTRRTTSQQKEQYRRRENDLSNMFIIYYNV